jgi:hypothetical protein
MAEGLTTPDGKAIAADPDDRAFAAAMAAPEPGQQPDYRPPARRDREAPHGRDAEGKPLAPHGVKADGTPRLVPPGPGRGHSRKNDAARVQKTAPGPQPGASALDPAAVRARRAQDATDTLELLSAAGSLYAMISGARNRAAFEKARAAGNKPLQDKAAAAIERTAVIQLDAAACALHAETAGPAIADVAGRNAFTAALVDRLALFNGVASVGIAVLPLVYQVIANHAPREVRDHLPPELLQLGVLPPALLLEKLQAQNAVKMARAQAEILAEKNAAEAELAGLRDQAAA